MARWLKALAAFPEDLNSDSGINIVGSQAPVAPAQRDLTLSFVYISTDIKYWVTGATIAPWA